MVWEAVKGACIGVIQDEGKLKKNRCPKLFWWEFRK
jgi:hypothetical protein